jgi:hypothetical protein
MKATTKAEAAPRRNQIMSILNLLLAKISLRMLSTFLIPAIFIAAACGGGGGSIESGANARRQQSADASSASAPPASQSGFTQTPTPPLSAATPAATDARVSDKPNGGSAGKPLPKEVSELARRARELEQKGRDMEAFRNGKTETELKKCNDLTVVNSVALEAFKRLLIESNLPSASPAAVNYKERLYEATGHLNNCLSCTSGALKFCDQARLVLNDLEK